MERNAECIGMLKKVISPSVAESSVKAEPSSPIMVTKQKEKLLPQQKQNFDMLKNVIIK